VQSEPQARVLGGGRMATSMSLCSRGARPAHEPNCHTAASCSSNAAGTIRRNSSIACSRTGFMVMLKLAPSHAVPAIYCVRPASSPRSPGHNFKKRASHDAHWRSSGSQRPIGPTSSIVPLRRPHRGPCAASPVGTPASLLNCRLRGNQLRIFCLSHNALHSQNCSPGFTAAGRAAGEVGAEVIAGITRAARSDVLGGA